MEEEKPQQKQSQDGQKNAFQIFLEELIRGAPEQSGRLRRMWRVILIPVLAIISGLLVGGVIMILTSEEVFAAWAQSPLASLAAAFDVVSKAYSALFTGSLGDPARIIAALQSGDGLAIRRAFNPIFESLVSSVPYIFAGLSVALGFRAGLFNIGAEGQIFVGAICAAFAGYAITGVPGIIHIPLAILAGAIGGGLWGFIPGWLKAKTGGHEVINTIMMNFIAFRLSDWLLSGPMQRPESFNPVSPTIQATAVLPRFFDHPIFTIRKQFIKNILN